MLRWALILLVIALVSGVFGFTHAGSDTGAMARITMIISGLLFVVFLILGRKIERRNPEKL